MWLFVKFVPKFQLIFIKEIWDGQYKKLNVSAIFSDNQYSDDEIFWTDLIEKLQFIYFNINA